MTKLAGGERGAPQSLAYKGKPIRFCQYRFGQGISVSYFLALGFEDIRFTLREPALRNVKRQENSFTCLLTVIGIFNVINSSESIWVSVFYVSFIVGSGFKIIIWFHACPDNTEIMLIMKEVTITGCLSTGNNAGEQSKKMKISKDSITGITG